MHPEEFSEVLERVTREADQFLHVSKIASGEAFESMLDSMIEAFTQKVGDILTADRASVFLLDESRGELWSKAARDASGELLEIRIPRDAGIAGTVASTGETINLPDVHADPRWNPSADRESGYRTQSLLCIPLRNAKGDVFAVAQALNKRDGTPFDAKDEKRFAEFMSTVGVLLETWWHMGTAQQTPSGSDPS
jgi:adenylate cyclase